MTQILWSDRAFGKVILLGEHAVVYGHRGLAGALALGVTVESTPGSGELWVMETCATKGEVLGRTRLEAAHVLTQAYAVILASLRVRREGLGVDLNVSFAIPAGAGLGSSAAFAVAVARAAARHAPGACADDIAQAAHAAEMVFHGRASGIDQAIAQSGGYGLYRRGEGLRPLLARPLTLCIGSTGRARDTRALVASVAALHERDRAATEACFHHVAACVEAGARALVAGDLAALGAAMNENQIALVELGVSCPEIDALCRVAREHGALGAKLTGAGGGGCVIALAPDTDGLRTAWQAEGFASFVASIGVMADEGANVSAVMTARESGDKAAWS